MAVKRQTYALPSLRPEIEKWSSSRDQTAADVPVSLGDMFSPSLCARDGLSHHFDYMRRRDVKIHVLNYFLSVCASLI